jgi:hypothetical protein
VNGIQRRICAYRSRGKEGGVVERICIREGLKEERERKGARKGEHFGNERRIGDVRHGGGGVERGGGGRETLRRGCQFGETKTSTLNLPEGIPASGASSVGACKRTLRRVCT